MTERDRVRNAVALAIFAAVLIALSACQPYGVGASPGVRDGAPYYRGIPGGTPIEVLPPVDYRLPGSAR